MLVLTGFADEISDRLEEQLDVLVSEGISYLELRSVYGKNVLELTDEELVRLKSALSKTSIRVSSIGSPIGKYPIQAPLPPNLRN